MGIRDGELAAPVAEGDDRQATPCGGLDIVADADPRQFGALDIDGHGHILAS
ncbi:hypothetical protein [uncultured Microbacterium sp.]|uniref:hypothetical protein n=1 Tax=uncultured Microbacterium sp. TaxID=191216 RepID=UPI002586AAC5|nr:hypothetical protein [uncultured Microbacterium sp.]|tara:strand:+ start:1361 stop:1516 length:156 start_codon:yes stop_codon:yes gene_type:complete